MSQKPLLTFESVIRRASKEKVVLTCPSEKEGKNLRNKIYKEKKALIITYPGQFADFSFDTRFFVRSDGKAELILQPQLYGVGIELPNSVSVSFSDDGSITDSNETETQSDSTEGLLGILGE